MISEIITTVVTWITYAVVCQAINVFGIVNNVVNIICFTKQGFTDPINVSLLGMEPQPRFIIFETLCIYSEGPRFDIRTSCVLYNLANNGRECRTFCAGLIGWESIRPNYSRPRELPLL